ncbi:MAG TPA: GNAT family N-acetyltransferase [Blastocatellia bacterium]|nr:GNAT family N-acetyltransferase [Blastocatellia bacterium]
MSVTNPAAYEKPAWMRKLAVRRLTEASRGSALALLSGDQQRGIHLYSLIKDNGFSHPTNRGVFYGCFAGGELVGVALLGHSILLYALPGYEETAFSEFARVANKIRAKGHVIFGPRAWVESFFNHLSQHGRETRLMSEHRWYVCEQAKLPLERLQLSRANYEQLDALMEAHAEMFIESSGVDPRLTDPEGFRRRSAERIERKRTWVKLEDGRVVFKVEIVSETEEAVYLEGVWTHPDYRGRGVATSCLNEITCRLLKKKKAVCLSVEPEEEAARRVYERVGFLHTEDYEARYLKSID